MTIVAKLIASTIILLLLPDPANNQGPGVLRVKSGQTIEITTNFKPFFVDEFIMEDNSTIVVRIPKWELRAERAYFGANARIVANGESGISKAGSTQPARSGRPGAGVTGGSGIPGEQGGNGGLGSEIIFTLGLIQIGGLTIEAEGGPGGQGGNGGKGQEGGRGKCLFPSTRGGSGGNGGGSRGGDGGNGGLIAIDYWVPAGAQASWTTSVTLEGDTTLSADLPGLNPSVKGGAGGMPGIPGAGGDKGRGVPKCGPIGGGRGDGEAGSPGEAITGKQGKPGKVVVRRIYRPPLVAVGF